MSSVNHPCAAATDDRKKAGQGDDGNGDCGIVEKNAGTTSQVSSKHWRKIRSAVAALAAFRSRRVKAADFERIKMCGEGGSGLVYLVKFKSTSMYFALKVQRKIDLEAKEKRIRRALIEREVLVTCAHPFVCNLYTAFQDSRHLYLLMDFCAGGDLTNLIRDVVKRPLTEDEARFYVSEIVAALEWVHLHGYVYRDLKPENVLIHESGHIRLGDFGTAERGSVKCPEKLLREEVERELLESKSATVVQAMGVAMEAVGGGPLHEVEEDEEDADDDAKIGEDIDRTLRGNTVVHLDPLLEKGNASSVGPKAAPADASSQLRNDAQDSNEDPSQDRPGTSPFVCCARPRQAPVNETSEAPVASSSSLLADSETFSRGRGSVKLNVLLDSQTFIGTADFMSPEMVTGKERQGEAMDWWALGVMLYEMTLGILPFNSQLEHNNNEIFRSIVNAELSFPRGHKLSHAAVDFIQELLRKDPEQRLGRRKGVGEIKRHDFFAKTHWALLAHETPPFQVSGPNTPGWITSITSDPASVMDDKMATWTWNVTDDGLRPRAAVVDRFNAAKKAQNYLNGDSFSEDSSQAMANPLRPGNGVDIPAGLSAADGSGKAAGAGKLGVHDDSIDTAGITPVTRNRSASEVPGVGTPGLGSFEAASSNDLEPLKRQGSKSVPVTRMTAGKLPAQDVSTGSPHRASFEGYDFNTIRKVGSLAIGTTGRRNPRLSVSQSADAVSGSKP